MISVLNLITLLHFPVIASTSPYRLKKKTKNKILFVILQNPRISVIFYQKSGRRVKRSNFKTKLR